MSFPNHHERTEAEMLVRAQSISNRSSVPVSLRTQPMLAAQSPTSMRARVVARRPGRYEYEKAWREKNREKVKAYAKKYAARWYAENPQVSAERQRKFREQNKEHVKARDAKYRARYKDKRKVYMKEYMRRLRDADPMLSKEYHARQIEKLADWYVRGKLSAGNSVPRDEWPESIVKLKRQIIKTKRLWKRQKDSSISTN